MEYDIIERETLKAILIVKGDKIAWIPKSCIILLDKKKGKIEIVDDFEVQWKHESSLNKTTSEDRGVKLTSDNIDDLWEYI